MWKKTTKGFRAINSKVLQTALFTLERRFKVRFGTRGELVLPEVVTARCQRRLRRTYLRNSDYHWKYHALKPLLIPTLALGRFISNFVTQFSVCLWVPIAISGTRNVVPRIVRLEIESQ